MLETLSHIVALYDSFPEKLCRKIKDDPKGQAQAHSMLPRAYFDGAAQNGLCGCGVQNIVDDNNQYLIHWCGGMGTNSKAEASTLAGLLNFCFFLNIQAVSIFGDSKVMVDFVLGKDNIYKSHLLGWMDKINFFWRRMEGSSIHHICRAQNQQADSLSKEGLHSDLGFWYINVISEGKAFHIQDFSFPGF